MELKYLLFVWNEFYPLGGWRDYFGVYETYDDALFIAIRALQESSGDHFQIVNRETLQIIKTQ